MIYDDPWSKKERRTDRLITVAILSVCIMSLCWAAFQVAHVWRANHIILDPPLWSCTEWDGTRTVKPTRETCTQWTQIWRIR